MSNPLILQGTLNRLSASVVLAAYPTLNVTPSYLGKEAIKLALEGNATDYIPTLTGGVPSPNPYQICTVSIQLLKTQPLSAQYKAQMELNALIGDITVRPDVNTGLSPYDITNCSIMTVREQDYGGTDAGWMVSLQGYYLINSSLWG